MLACTALLWEKKRLSLLNILPGLGICGTFIGIMFSLWQIDVQDIQSSIPTVLSGMQIAFITSVTGMALSIIIRIYIEKTEGDSKEESTIDTVVVALEKMTSEIVSLKDGIIGDGESALSTHMQKMRMSIIDKNDELIAEFKNFAEQQAENNTNALIDALKDVMKDFNTKINEQFGDNFKQLNEAVGRMLVWQENYYKEIEAISNQIKDATVVIEKNKEIIEEVNNKYVSAMEVSEKLEKAIDCYDLQRETLESNLEKFSELADSSKDIFPSIEENINNLTESFKEAVIEASQEASAVVVGQKDQLEQNLSNLNKIYESNLSDISALSSQIIGNIEKAGSEISTNLNEQLNLSLSSLGQQLTALSKQFVDDYTPLTRQLQKIVRISDGGDGIQNVG